MTESTQQVVVQALRLPRQSRAFVAEKLLERLDYDDDFEVSGEWMDEVRRRCKEIDEGAVELIAAEEVFREIASELE